MTTLIVSSPHALCVKNSKKRSCDSAAGLASQVFYYAADDYNKLNCIAFPGDEYRINHDLNRKASRNTPYRQRLEQFLQQCDKAASITIDIHSFPNEYLIAAGNINFFKQGEIAPDIVILEGPRDVYKGKSLSHSIYSALHDKIECKIIRGISVNDILNNSAEHAISGVLLEFNERFNDNPDQLFDLCSIIASVLASF